MRHGPLPALAGGALVVAGLAALTVPGGWLMFIPVLLTFAVVGGAIHRGAR